MRTKARFPEVKQQAGHYESFYLKLNRPGGGQAVWIRHTVHQRPGEPPTCALWFVYFDAEAAAPRATKRQFGAEQLDAPAHSYIRVADALLGDGRATGSVNTEALSASWDLSFSDEHEPFHHLPRDFLYGAPLPKTKFLSPYPNAIFNGRIEVDGEVVEIDGWRGMIGHNWGAEHAERWVWVQGAAFEGRDPGDYFDMAVGRIKVAGLTTPWVGNGMLVLDGRPHRLGGFERIRSTVVEEAPTGARFQLRGRQIRVTGRVGAERKDFVAWVYADPVGPEHNTLNCSISDLELDVELGGGPAMRLTVSGAAAYEFGTRDTDHGIPVQPYPDG
ncbi:MAG TPA: hypothetical protein VHH72_11095 [Solirubrobacterales bacterium]|jgi:hypothetical protein|nr:hypothetical protein [Solirubrobacterales bacterium]